MTCQLNANGDGCEVDSGECMFLPATAGQSGCECEAGFEGEACASVMQCMTGPDGQPCENGGYPMNSAARCDGADDGSGGPCYEDIDCDHGPCTIDPTHPEGEGTCHG